MTLHEQFAEDLALYALGCLEGEEKLSLEKHLADCASCRRELEQLRGDTALLALSAVGAKPPLRAKARLMNALAQEPPRRAVSRVPWWSVLGWITAAVLIGLVAVLWNQNSRLRSNAVKLTALVEQQKLDLEKNERIAGTLNAKDATSITLLPVKMNSAPPVGRAVYSRQRAGLIFMASNLSAVPPQKAYELWLIPTQGAPIAAGVFMPDARGNAIIINPPLPAGVEAKAFAITIEPEQGSAAPTTPIVMMGGA